MSKPEQRANPTNVQDYLRLLDKYEEEQHHIEQEREKRLTPISKELETVGTALYQEQSGVMRSLEHGLRRLRELTKSEGREEKEHRLAKLLEENSE